MKEEESKQHYEAAQRCIEKLQVLTGLEEITETWRKAAEEMRSAGDYLDAQTLAETYEKEGKAAVLAEKEKLYRKVRGRIEDDSADVVIYKLAREELRAIQDYKDIPELMEKCDQRIAIRERRQRRRSRCRFLLIGGIVLAVIAGVSYHENALYQEQQATESENTQ